MKTILQKHIMLFHILIHFSVPALFFLSKINRRLTGLSNFRKSNFFNSHDIWHMVSTGNFKHLQEHITPALLFATFSARYNFHRKHIKMFRKQDTEQK